MIKQVEIINFRNLKHQIIPIEVLTSILTGANNIGKSNSLNALHWFFTNTLLTDNWGTGENDLNSIVPTDMVKGEHTQVSITLDTGAVFTKIYKTGFDRVTGLPNKHSTEYKINGVAYSNLNDFQAELFKELKFMPKLKCKKDVDELRLFIDPLYALQKLEPKKLRLLLVDLGCSVSNDEVYAYKPELQLLQAYESKYLGDFTTMRQSLKSERLTLVKQLEALELTLNSFSGLADSYDPSHRKELEAKRDELTTKISNLESGNIDATKDIDITINQLESEKNLAQQKFNLERDNSLNQLRAQAKEAKDKALKASNEKLQNLNAEINNLNWAKKSHESTAKAYANTLNVAAIERDNIRKEVTQMLESQSTYQARLESIKNRQFVGFVTCPDCGKVFAPDETALILFNKQKQDELKQTETALNNIADTIKFKQKQFNESKENDFQITHELKEVQSKIVEIENKVKELELKKQDVESATVDLTEVEALESQINDLLNTHFNCSKWDTQIQILQNKKQQIFIDAKMANEKMIDDLKAELEPLMEEIEEEYLTQSKISTRADIQAQMKSVSQNLNDKESLLAKVNEFIQTRISLMNNKAKEITGLDFVMLEENLTNDGVKEVCYATVDNVDFGNVNTSKKLEVGIQFIQRIKNILGANDLPILADRMEGFDDIEKIRNLTTEQLICTVVGDKNQKQIVII